MFVHLHNHTKFSILDALCKPHEIVKRAKELGQCALAITDHGVVYGWIEFYKECKAQGVKPILGCELYVAPKTISDKDSHERYHHLVALAENNEGMMNLQKLCSEGFTAGGMYYGKPRVDDVLLNKYHEGIIFLSGCIAGRIPKMILRGEVENASREAKKYEEMFGKGNFFLEIQDHGDEQEKIVADALIEISKKTGIPLVATNDCHYIMPEDAAAHEVLLYMRDEKTVESPSPAYGNGQLYLKSEEEMNSIFGHIPEALENTAKIADRCNIEIIFHETKMPKAPIPEGKDAYSYLKELCHNGAKERYGEKYADVTEQLDYELSVIKNMGFVEYFLVVWEYINWSRANGVTVGPGRGSAAGSIAMYCLGITDIEPKRFNLVFERFLNPERVSMPDIDEDFDDINRYKTINHVRELYGKDNVCQIITFGTMAAKKVIKSVGKVYGYEVAFYNALSNLVPKDVGMTLKKALDEAPDFKYAYENDHKAKRVIDMGLILEGLPCNTSKHAAGVIIADKPVGEYIPLALTKDGDLVSQFNMVEIEELGLLKMDFLGLKTLSVIDEAIKNIKNTTGKDIVIDDIDYDDPAVYKFISSGKTAGVFQLESSGMMSFMKQLKPRSLEDLTAGVALYRPGPMDFIPKYIEGKNNPNSISYACPELEPILKTTYGCIVYQEQVMQIFQNLAGYSLGGADNIRRAMSKKKQKVIDEEKNTFIYGNLATESDPKKQVKGCINNGISEEAATEIYESMTDFAKYAFNKSHAACYAVISYQTAWLKYYYPAEYMASIMTVFIESTDKLVSYIGATKELGIKMLRPDINKSTDSCTVENGMIRMPLSMCKGTGVPSVRSILEERERKGQFKSFDDFILSGCCNDKTALGSLISAGAFDDFGTRRTFLDCYPSILENFRKEKKKNVEGQMSLFDIVEPEEFKVLSYPEMPEFAEEYKLELEKDALGTYISAHPLDVFSDICAIYRNCTSSDFIKDDTGRCEAVEGEIVNFCGYISNIKEIYTKKGEKMAFITAEDYAGEASLILFPGTYEQKRDSIKQGMCYLIKGVVGDDRGEDKPLGIIINEVYPLNSLPFKIWLKVKNNDAIDNVRSYINGHKEIGERPGRVYVYVEDTKQTLVYNEERISIHEKKGLEKLLGPENVAIRQDNKQGEEQ